MVSLISEPVSKSTNSSGIKDSSKNKKYIMPVDIFQN